MIFANDQTSGWFLSYCILLILDEEKEAAINWIETFEDEEQVWINAKTKPTHKLAHKAGISEQPPK